MRKSELITGFYTLLIAGFTWMISRDIPFQDLKAGLGPAFFPYLLLVILAGLGIIYLIFGLFTRSSLKTTKTRDSSYWKIIIIFGLLVIYSILFKHLGFVISTLLFLVSSMLTLKVKWFHAILISTLAISGLYLIFIIFLKVPLP